MRDVRLIVYGVLRLSSWRESGNPERQLITRNQFTLISALASFTGDGSSVLASTLFSLAI